MYGECVAGGNGVRGVSNAGVGVRGQGGQFGMLAETMSGTGVALRAQVLSGIGAYGSSQNNDGSGVYGENLGGGFGVRAYSTGVGLYAQGNTRAAVFQGDVEVRGRLILPGQVLQGSDGPASATEATASRAEHVGRAKLANGRATVALDKAFADTVDAADYDVTITPYGECNGVFVAGRTPGGFEVRELRGGTSSVEFNYRVIARVKPGAREQAPNGVVRTDPNAAPSVRAPEIPPAWRGQPQPAKDDIPPAWRNIPPAAPEPRRPKTDGDGADDD